MALVATALVATALERNSCYRGSSCPSRPICRTSSRQMIATHAKKNCHGHSRHYRRRHRRRHRGRRYSRHHSRRHGHRRCHRHCCQCCRRRCQRRRWNCCYHCIGKPAVQPGLCLNLWLLYFVQEKRKGEMGLLGRLVPGERFRRF